MNKMVKLFLETAETMHKIERDRFGKPNDYVILHPDDAKLITEIRIKLWQLNGNDCGFPQCCIDFFCTVHPSDRPQGYSYYNGKFNSSGFIACPEHKQQILAGKTTLSDLIDYIKRKPSLGKFKESWESYGE